MEILRIAMMKQEGQEEAKAAVVDALMGSRNTQDFFPKFDCGHEVRGKE